MPLLCVLFTLLYLHTRSTVAPHQQPQRMAPEDSDTQAPDNVAGPGPSSEAVAAATATFVKRNRNRANLRKRPNEGEGSGDDDKTQVEKKAKAGRSDALTFNSKQQTDEQVHVTYESTRAIQSGRDESVFKTLETETEVDRDARYVQRTQLAFCCLQCPRAQAPAGQDHQARAARSWSAKLTAQQTC